MGDVSIDEIKITTLARISLEQGDVLHAVKAKDPGFKAFGEAYFSIIKPGAIKAWKRHKIMTLNLVVPVGGVKFVFIDSSVRSREEIIGAGIGRYVRLTVPPGIWFGFMGVYEFESVLMNIADIPHQPSEVDRKKIEEIKYEWR
jgi:dTDP-4-dehydrorhamnose 3,5-epimerase